MPYCLWVSCKEQATPGWAFMARKPNDVEPGGGGSPALYLLIMNINVALNRSLMIEIQVEPSQNNSDEFVLKDMDPIADDPDGTPLYYTWCESIQSLAKKYIFSKQEDGSYTLMRMKNFIEANDNTLPASLGMVESDVFITL